MVKRQQKPKFKSPKQRWKNDCAEKIFYDIYKKLPANVKKKPDAQVAAECYREAVRLYPGRNGQQRWQRTTEAMLKKLPVLKERYDKELAVEDLRGIIRGLLGQRDQLRKQIDDLQKEVESEDRNLFEVRSLLLQSQEKQKELQRVEAEHAQKQKELDIATCALQAMGEQLEKATEEKEEERKKKEALAQEKQALAERLQQEQEEKNQVALQNEKLRDALCEQESKQKEIEELCAHSQDALREARLEAFHASRSIYKPEVPLRSRSGSRRPHRNLRREQNRGHGRHRGHGRVPEVPGVPRSDDISRRRPRRSDRRSDRDYRRSRDGRGGRDVKHRGRRPVRLVRRKG